MDNVNIQSIINKHHYKAIGEKNPYIKQARNLVNNNKPNPEKLFIAEGLWSFNKLVEHNATLRSLIICPSLIHTKEAINNIDKLSKITKFRFTVSEKTFEKLSTRDKPDGMLAIAEFPHRELKDFKVKDDSVILVLDGIEIPGNLGTMIRMSDGAGVDAVFVCNRKARLTHPKLIKGSMGAVLSVPIYEFESVKECHDWLNDNGYTVYLTDTRATKHYHQEPFGVKSAIVMGSERYGISQQWYTDDVVMISIPMLGSVDSLNVGVAATVIVYEATIKNKLQGR